MRWILTLVLVLGVCASYGQDAPPPDTAPTTQTQPAQPDPLRSPRSALREFLLAVSESEQKPERINDAVACLDLSGLEPADAAERGPILAKQLEAIIEHFGVTLDTVPDAETGEAYIYRDKDEQRIELARQDDGRWRFTAGSIAAIPMLLKTVGEEATTRPAEAVTDVPPGRRSARATVKTFLEAVGEGDLEAAANCLDLSSIPQATQMDVGQRLAVKLKSVMDRIELVVLQEISDDPLGKPHSLYVSDQGRIEIGRVEAEERNGEWLFTAGTVKSIEKLYEVFQDKALVQGVQRISFRTAPWLWLRERVGSRLQGKWLLMEHWQWLVLAAVVLLSLGVHRLVAFLLGLVTRGRMQAEHVHVSEKLMTASLRPIGILAMVLTWWGGLQLLDLGQTTIDVIWPAMRFVLTGAGVWAAYRLIDLAMGYFAARAARTETRMDDVLVPLVRKVLKIVVLAVGVVVLLQAVGVSQGSVDKLFAGLGLGGLAFALAAQDTIKNFFGSVTVVLDRPFQVGDWVKVGNVEGTVDTVGLRSSRIRTFYNSEVTIPNTDLMNTMIDNMGRRKFRRISCMLSVAYSTTPAQLEAFCEGVRELIRKHPYTRKDYFHVYVNKFAASSIDILLYCFHETPDWSTELRERHRLLVDIVRLAQKLGVELAFPTQTVHLHHESTPPTSPPAPPNVPGEPDVAMQFGRDQAAGIVREFLGDNVEKPPPVTF